MMKKCSRCHERPRQEKHAYCKICMKLYMILRRGPYQPKGTKMRHPAYRMYNSAQHRAKKQGREFSLILEDLVVPETCPVLGIPLDKRDMNHSPSLDRFDNEKGYTPDNVRIISFRANSIKQDASMDEVRAVLEYMTG